MEGSVIVIVATHGLHREVEVAKALRKSFSATFGLSLNEFDTYSLKWTRQRDHPSLGFSTDAFLAPGAAAPGLELKCARLRVDACA